MKKTKIIFGLALFSILPITIISSNSEPTYINISQHKYNIRQNTVIDNNNDVLSLSILIDTEFWTESNKWISHNDVSLKIGKYTYSEHKREINDETNKHQFKINVAWINCFDESLSEWNELGEKLNANNDLVYDHDSICLSNEAPDYTGDSLILDISSTHDIYAEGLIKKGSVDLVNIGEVVW